MFPVNCPVVQFFMKIIYCSLTAMTTCWISACLTPHTLWKTWRLSSYTRLSLYKAACVVLLGISIIPGCTGLTYIMVDSVAYLVLVIKSTRCL